MSQDDGAQLCSSCERIELPVTQQYTVRQHALAKLMRSRAVRPVPNGPLDSEFAKTASLNLSRALCTSYASCSLIHALHISYEGSAVKPGQPSPKPCQKDNRLQRRHAERECC